MSYCRFSSDDFRCELYCYEDVSGGYTTHVAGMKHVIDRSGLPPPVEWPPVDADEATFMACVKEYVARNEMLMKLLDGAPLAKIGLPHDGETFNDPDLESFLARVKSLKAMGYNVPDYVIGDIEAEIAEQAQDATPLP